MREIKFRAWDPAEKKMYKPFDLAFTLTEGLLVDGGWDRGNVFMQYTGIKDRNGKDIYEGDVVRRSYGVGYSSKHYPSFVDGTQRSKIVVVEWHKSYLGYEEISPPNDPNYDTEFEIIGNIYENPELIA